DRLEAFYDNPNALRDYFRDIGRMVLAAEGRKANDSHADCYQYFCVPEYGTAHGRLHFYAVHFMRTLPTDRKSGSAGMPRPIWYAVSCLMKATGVMLLLLQRGRNFMTSSTRARVEPWLA